jgi:hypothetical protein
MDRLSVLLLRSSAAPYASTYFLLGGRVSSSQKVGQY